MELSTINSILNAWQAGHTLFVIAEEHELTPELVLQLLDNHGVYHDS